MRKIDWIMFSILIPIGAGILYAFLFLTAYAILILEGGF